MWWSCWRRQSFRSNSQFSWNAAFVSAHIVSGSLDGKPLGCAVHWASGRWLGEVMFIDFRSNWHNLFKILCMRHPGARNLKLQLAWVLHLCCSIFAARHLSRYNWIAKKVGKFTFWKTGLATSPHCMCHPLTKEATAELDIKTEYSNHWEFWIELIYLIFLVPIQTYNFDSLYAFHMQQLHSAKK